MLIQIIKCPKIRKINEGWNYIEDFKVEELYKFEIVELRLTKRWGPLSLRKLYTLQETAHPPK